MASPQRTDYQFDDFNIALFIGSYIAIAKPLLKEYGVTLSDLRILCAIEGLTQLYGWRLQRMGISRLQLSKLCGFKTITIERCLLRLRDKHLLELDVERHGKRIVYRYTITKKGKAIVNRMTKVERVNETIISHLYGKRLLK